MRLDELERWLLRMGWVQQRDRGSHRNWTHALYPGQRLTYAVPHGTCKLPDAMIAEVYRDLVNMTPHREKAAG